MQGANYYSNGDKDMLAFELAFSSISLAMQLGAFKIDTDFTNNNAENVDGGNAQEAFYMLTGKCPENATDKGAMNKLLNTFQKNCDRDFAVCATRHIKEDKQVKDIDGKSITIYGNHVYAVKRADGDSVTIVNPHDSGKKITISRRTFLEAFESVQSIDLSIKGKIKNYTIQPKIKENGDKVFVYKNRYKGLVCSNGKTVYRAKAIHSKDGILKKEIFYDKNGNKIQTRAYNKDGTIKKIKTY